MFEFGEGLAGERLHEEAPTGGGPVPTAGVPLAFGPAPCRSTAAEAKGARLNATIGTFLTITTTYVLAPSRFNVWMIGTLAFSIGLVFFFLIAMDRPFAGEQILDLAMTGNRRSRSELRGRLSSSASG